MNCIVHGSSVSYSRIGKGPAVVLLHGWGDTSHTFDSLISELRKNYECIAVDLPGFGGSEAPKEPFDLTAYASFVVEFLKKIDAEHVYAIIGHSNGGAIAIKGISSGLLRAEKLILLASSGIRSSYQGRKRALRYVAKAAKIPTMLLPKTTQDRLKKRVYKTIGSDLFVAEHLQQTFKNVVSEDLVLDSAMISVPTLLLYGAQDSATPPRYGELFHKQIEGSALRIVESAGHFIHHEAHARVNSDVKEFLDA